MPMTYAMSMLSEVMTDTIRTDMVTSRINMSTPAGVSEAMRLATKWTHFAPAPIAATVVFFVTKRPRHKCAVR